MPEIPSDLLVWSPRRDSNPDLPITSRMLCVDLVGSRRIWLAHVGGLVDLVGSSRSRRIVWMIKRDDQAV